MRNKNRHHLFKTIGFYSIGRSVVYGSIALLLMSSICFAGIESIKYEMKAQIIERFVDLRVKPIITSAVIVKVSGGNELYDVIDRSGMWTKIRVKSHEGWVYSPFLAIREVEVRVDQTADKTEKEKSVAILPTPIARPIFIPEPSEPDVDDVYKTTSPNKAESKLNKFDLGDVENDINANGDSTGQESFAKEKSWKSDIAKNSDEQFETAIEPVVEPSLPSIAVQKSSEEKSDTEQLGDAEETSGTEQMAASQEVIVAEKGSDTEDMNQENAGADDVLGGFDDENTESSGGDDALLGGFDDDLGSDIEDALGGFDEGDETYTASPDIYKLERYSLDGTLKMGSSYSFAHPAPEFGQTDWRGISRFRPEVLVNFNAKLSPTARFNLGIRAEYELLYDLKGKDEFERKLIEEYEYDVTVEEAYILEKLTPKIDLKFGRQIIAWGKTDILQAINIINPVDSREPGVEASRLPELMTRLDYFERSWNLSAVIMHELRFNKIPVFGGEFFPMSLGNINEADAPSNSIENIEYALEFHSRYKDFDYSIYFADMYDNMPYLESVTDEGIANYKHLSHARIQMFGTAFSLPVWGEWLMKGEIAYKDGIKVLENPGGWSIPTQKFIASNETSSKIEIVGGTEYSGIQSTTILFEAMLRFKQDYTSLVDETESEDNEDDMDFDWVIAANRFFLRDTLSVQAGLVFYGLTAKNGSVQLIRATYDLLDSVNLAGGIVLYDINNVSGADTNESKVSDNDRLFFEVKYSF